MFVSIQLALATYPLWTGTSPAQGRSRVVRLGESCGNYGGFAMSLDHADSLRPEAHT